MGDLAFPAFALAKVLRKAPQQIALDIVDKIEKDSFEKVVAVGPYVNFFLDKSAFSNNVIKNVLNDGSNYGANDDGKKTVM